MPKTFTDDIRDFLLKKSHYLYRLENGTLKQLIVPYNKAKQQILNQIVSLQGQEPVRLFPQRIQILNNKLAEIEYTLHLAALESEGKLNEIRSQLATFENENYTKIFNSKLNKINISMDSLPYAQIDFIMNNPMLGESISDKMLWMNKQLVKTMRQELYQSIITGEDMFQAGKRLIGTYKSIGGTIGKQIINRMKIIARTEIMYVSNSVARGIFNRNTDVIRGLMYTATLDNRTCMQCAPLDGQIYEYKNGMNFAPYLPQHPFCRCIYSPQTYSWQQLQRNSGAEVTKQSQKDYFSGRVDKPIITYAKWFEKQDKPTQLSIMGKTRYDAWKSGMFKLGKEMMPQKESYSVLQYINIVNKI